MIYTAIFQDSEGHYHRLRYTGETERIKAWENAAHMGASDGLCLVLLIPGDHPIYTYEDVHPPDRTAVQNHDLFELRP